VGYPTSIVPLENVALENTLTYEKVLVDLFDHRVCRLRNKEVSSTKVLWRNQSIEGDTLEKEAALISKYPYLFPFDSVSA